MSDTRQDGMPYDPIQGQGHGCLKCAKMASSKAMSSDNACSQKINFEL